MKSTSIESITGVETIVDKGRVLYERFKLDGEEVLHVFDPSLRAFVDRLRSMSQDEIALLAKSLGIQDGNSQTDEAKMYGSP